MSSGCSSLSYVASTSFTRCAHFFQLRSSFSRTRSLAHFSASIPFTSTCPSSRFGTCRGCQVAVSRGPLVWVTGVTVSQVALDAGPTYESRQVSTARAVVTTNQGKPRLVGVIASWRLLQPTAST